MEAPNYHRLLQRQIRRFVSSEQMEGLELFLQSINEFYESAEQERKLLEHTLDVNSKELEELNRSLKQRYEELREQESLRNARDEAIIEKEVAIAANRAKDIFLANMSHELRTPLNAINGFSQILLAKTDTPESAKKFIEKIYIAGNNLLSLVNTILDFAKIEAGKVEVYYSLFIMDDLVKEVQILVESMAYKKKLSLELVLDIGIILNADRQLIKQVLVNLLSNAIKFSPEGETITLVHTTDEIKTIFGVLDHGHGIPKDKIATLFDPFVQIREHQNESIKGSGLGLSIVKKIIELHHGKVWIQSTEGEGSCFYFSLPKVVNP
jgi:signal transduction histidine kinase